MRIYYHLVLFVIVFSFYTPTYASKVKYFHERIDGLFSAQNYSEMPTLLRDLNQASIKTFGGGVGPVTPEYLQFILVNNVFEKRGGFDDITFDGSCDDEGCVYWKNIITGFEEGESITRMLENGNPAVRLVAVVRIKESGEKEKYESRLEYMIENDPYVVIQRKTPKSENDRPVPPGYTVNDFTAPVRSIVMSSLGDGLESTIDHRAVSKLGIMQLMHDFKEADEEFRDEILFAINMLDEKSHAIEYLRELESSDILTDRQLRLMKVSIEDYTKLKMFQYRGDEDLVTALINSVDTERESSVSEKTSLELHGGNAKDDGQDADSKIDNGAQYERAPEKIFIDGEEGNSRERYGNSFYVISFFIIFLFILIFIIYIYIKKRKSS